jgi:hypothetical protein
LVLFLFSNFSCSGPFLSFLEFLLLLALILFSPWSPFIAYIGPSFFSSNSCYYLPWSFFLSLLELLLLPTLVLLFFLQTLVITYPSPSLSFFKLELLFACLFLLSLFPQAWVQIPLVVYYGFFCFLIELFLF